MAKKNNNSSFFLEIFKKIFNHYIVQNVLALVLAGLFIFYATLVILKHYTHHGESILVPDVRGLTFHEAGILLRSHNMRWQLSDSVYVSSVEPGAIVNQNPEPGSRVKTNRNVFLVVNALAPERVTMPNVVGISLRQAKSTLESIGLSVGTLTYVPDIARDNVLRQLYRGREIRRGTEIVKGSEIELVLGRGLSDETTNVPNITGKTLSEAREILTQYFLNFGVIIYDENTIITRADSIRAYVYRQRPVATTSATLQLGSTVDVWLTFDESGGLPQENE